MRSATWRPMRDGDMVAVDAVADAAHPDLFERPEVLVEKARLCPEGAMVLDDGCEVVGYGFAHPWRLFDVPPLDAFLGAVPEDADCLWVHDVAVRPEARGRGHAAGCLDIVRDVATRSGLRFVAGAAVHGTHALWERHGFEVVDSLTIRRALDGYGDARYVLGRAWRT